MGNAVEAVGNTVGGALQTVGGVVASPFDNGQTLKQNLYEGEISNIIYSPDNPFKKDSHLKILKGNIASDGCIAKINSEDKTFIGSLKCFDTEIDMVLQCGIDKFDQIKT